MTDTSSLSDSPLYLNDLVQGTQLWKDIRKDKVTSTDVSVILGHNPFKTVQTLLQHKLYDVKDDIRLIMTQGNIGEPLAIAEYMMEFPHEGPFFHTGLILEAPARGSDFASSPDLLCGRDGCVEVKTRAYHFTKDIPMREYCQIQFNMAVSQRAWTDHVQYMFGKKLKVERVLYNRAWWSEVEPILRTWKHEHL